MRQRYRLAYIVSHPIQYQVPLLRRITEESDIDLTVYYCWRGSAQEKAYDQGFGVSFKWDIPLLEGYRYKFLKNISPFPRHWPIGLVNHEIINELRRERYDAVWMHGYVFVSMWMAFLTARLIKTPVLLRGESSLLNKTSRSKRMLKRAIFNKASCLLSIGKCNMDFYRYLGISNDRIFFMPYAVDNQFFQKESQAISYKKSQLKRELGIPAELPVVLYAGKLIPRKRPMDLLTAYAAAAEKISAALLFVGEGSERIRLDAYCKRSRLNLVYFAGFKNQAEISRYYAVADIFVMSSEYEPWGLAINEAMNFSLPIVTTDRVAAAYDLVKTGENGFVYPAGNTEELKACLKTLLMNAALREKMGKRSLQEISKWSYSKDIEGLTNALKFIDKR